MFLRSDLGAQAALDGGGDSGARGYASRNAFEPGKVPRCVKRRFLFTFTASSTTLRSSTSGTKPAPRP